MATRYQFVDDSGETRLAGFLVPEPGGSSAVLVSTKPLTAAQLKALVATPVELVPAPGPGKVIVPIAIAVQVKYGGVAFTVTGSDVEVVCGFASFWTFQEGQGSGFTPSPGASIFDQALDVRWFGQPTGNGSAFNVAMANLPVNVQNFGSNLAAGNGSAQFDVYYAVADVPT